MIEILKEIILDFHNELLETGIKRDLRYELVKGKAFICMGVRRSGKSTLLYQIIDSLERQGVKRENTLYLNFFDDRLTELKHSDLSIIMDAYYSLYPEKKGIEQIYCFFDEIQEVNNWEPFIDRIMRTEKAMVFITGSSAKMLSKEIATQMRGRSIAYELFPFSFKEFLDYKETDYKNMTSRNRLLVQKGFEEYWQKGGFPEVCNVSDKLRLMIHQEYYKAILHRDVIERFDAAHPQAIIQAGYRLINNTASLYSINRLTEYLRTLGYKVSKGFVSSCLAWFQDAYFLFTLKIFDPSLARQNINTKKIYCVDNGLIRSISTGILVNAGHLLENMIFAHLRRITENIFYYRTKSGYEVDFIWIGDKGEKNLVQVSLSLSDVKTLKREISSLKEAMKELGVCQATIVTLKEDKKIEEENIYIDVVSAPKYLLQIC